MLMDKNYDEACGSLFTILKFKNNNGRTVKSIM